MQGLIAIKTPAYRWQFRYSDLVGKLHAMTSADKVILHNDDAAIVEWLEKD